MHVIMTATSKNRRIRLERTILVSCIIVRRYPVAISAITTLVKITVMENLPNIVSVVTTGERNGNLAYLYIGREQVEHGILFANHTSRHMVPDYHFGIE